MTRTLGPAATLVLCAACTPVKRPSDAATRASLVLEAPDTETNFTHARFSPESAVASTSLVGARLVVTLNLAPSETALGAVTRADTLRIDVDGACPLTVDLASIRAGDVIRRDIRPWLDFGGPYAEVGFDTPLVIDVHPGCPEARNGRIEWNLRPGGAINGVRTENDGFRLLARTPSLREALGRSPPWGVVPIAPSSRGESVLEATWQANAGDSARTLHREVHVAAAGRCRGLPNVSVNSRVWLGGEGWHVTRRPDGDGDASQVRPEDTGSSSFEAHTTGLFALEDRDGRSLSLRAARYDETPLDCARATCHTAIGATVERSPMTSVLARGLAGSLGPYDNAACALSCHATGEPGLEDGGFTDVARTLAFPVSSAHAWQDLPLPLRRLGGVGCLACHGPGAIPEPSARWSILRSDVCAYCHDAPPRYGHVAAWKSSAMARADQDPNARRDPACARCHTTSGFLADISDTAARAAPIPIGITCAACHAAHADGPHGGSGGTFALLREVDLPTTLASLSLTAATRARTSVCLKCHSPSDSTPPGAGPAASVALLWAGRGGLDPTTSAPLVGPAPHLAVDGGCVGCHRAGPSDVELGAGHAFRAAESACTSCHTARPRQTELQARARAAYEKLVGGAARTPPHVAPGRLLAASSPAARAAFDVLLVLEDPAADVHNLPYARKLLERAERVIDTVAKHPASVSATGVSRR